MSEGNRKSAEKNNRDNDGGMARRERDFYPTPRSVIDALLDRCPPPINCLVIEPEAGDGAIVRALADRDYDVIAIDIHDEREALVAAGAKHALCADWLTYARSVKKTKPFSIVGNPPFSRMLEHAEACIATGAIYTALLLPTAFLHSKNRFKFNHRYPPTSMLTIANRVSFTGGKGSPPRDVSWIIWDRRYEPMEIRPVIAS